MDHNSLDDAEIWDSMAKGSRETYAYIYTTYSKDLYSYGLRITTETDLVEDIIQDTFVLLWDGRERLIIQKSIKFYLFSCFRRELVKRLKTNHRSESLEEYHLNMSWEESFQEILVENQITLESNQKISKAMETLSVRQKEAIFLRYIQELSYEEISQLMGIQVPSLYNLIFKGIKTMKDFLSSSHFTAKSIVLFLMMSQY
jgi:RNA polymerase sigma factor (sigma-70 family)